MKKIIVMLVFMHLMFIYNVNACDTKKDTNVKSKPKVEEKKKTKKEKNTKNKSKCKIEKIKICHIPKGNKNNAHVINISKNALKAHLKHGDYIGECVKPPVTPPPVTPPPVIKAYCGDGLVNNIEQCDGSAGIGEHQVCSDACTLVTLPFCGDSILNNDEECEGLNIVSCNVNGYAGFKECDNCFYSVCTAVEYCGDSITNGNETCDDGSDNGSPLHCNTTCNGTTPHNCDNGITEIGEECDDGNSISGDGCSETCKLENCNITSFNITQLTNNTTNDTYPDINDNNDIVWKGIGANGKFQLYLNNNQITENSENLVNDYSKPQVNELDEIAWQSYSNGWYLSVLKNGNISQFLTGNIVPKFDMNKYGEIVYKGKDYSGTGTWADVEIFYYDGATSNQITFNDYNDDEPRMNDNGEVVFLGADVNDGVNAYNNIFRYDRARGIKRVTDKHSYGANYDINNANTIAYVSYENSKFVLVTDDANDVKKVTALSDRGNGYAKINNKEAKAIHQQEICVIDNDTIKLKTTNAKQKKGVIINDKEVTVWTELVGAYWQVMAYNGTDVIQVTTTNGDKFEPKINSNNVIVYYGFDGTDYEIYSATAFVVCQ